MLSAISIHDLAHSYGGPKGPRALDGVDFCVERGEVVALTGRSGSGKTTLLALIAGLLKVQSGQIRIGQVAVERLTASGRAGLRRGTVAVVFQDHNLIPELTAVQNVWLASEIAGAAAASARHRAQTALDAVGLGDKRARLPRALSGGESQRVAIARALAVGTAVILADEPTGSLDAENAVAVMRALRRSAEASGTSVIVASHDPEVVSRADRALHLQDGRLR